MSNDNAGDAGTQNEGAADTTAAPAGATDTGSVDTGSKDAAALTPEQQADADKATADAKAAEDASKAKPEGAPEKYEFKLPEGQVMDAGVQAQFEAVARELNMPQEAAQKLLETMSPKIQEAQAAQMIKVREGWVAEMKADKDLGGSKLDENLAVAKKAMDTLATPGFKTFLNESGLGDHPEMVRLLVKAGRAISEDKPSGQGNGAANPRQIAKTLYPSSN